MNNNKKYINLIFKVLTKEANKDEISSFNEQIGKDMSYKKLFNSYKKTWDISGKVENKDIINIDINDEWSKLEHEVSQKHKLTENKIHHRKINKFSFYKIAAAILVFILAGAGILYTFKTDNKTITAENTIIKSKLPDGSQITLNRKSEITYPDDFNKKNRKIRLLNGEVYFKVTKNKNKTFTVETGNIFIRVTGTEFNVNNNSGNTEVIVKEGEVRISKNIDKKSSIRLSQGDKATYIKSKKTIVISRNKDINYMSWKTKVFYFVKAPFPEIISKIEKAYGVKIEILCSILDKESLTVNFDNQTLTAVLNVLKSTLDLTIEKNGNLIKISRKNCL